MSASRIRSKQIKPPGNNQEVLFNNNDVLDAAANVEIHDGDLIITSSSDTVPSLPPSDYFKIFGKRFGSTGSRAMAAVMGPSGMDYTLQPAIFRQAIAIWQPPGNATTVPGVFGMTAPTAVGTATARTVTTATIASRTKRLGYVSNAAAAALCGHYHTTAQYTTGSGSGFGGFFYSCRFVVSDATIQTTARMFVGLSSTVAAPTNVDPATILNCIGVGCNSGDTALFIYYGGSTAQTRIATGITIFNNTLFNLNIWCPPSERGVIYWRLEQVEPSGGPVVEGKITPTTVGVQTPNITTLLAHRAWRCTNAGTTAVGIDIANVYIETDW